MWKTHETHVTNHLFYNKNHTESIFPTAWELADMRGELARWNRCLRWRAFVAPQPGDVKEGSGPVMASWTSTSDIFRHVTCCTHQLTEQPQESGKRQQAPNPPTGVFLCLSPVSSPSEKTPMTGPAAVRLDAIS